MVLCLSIDYMNVRGNPNKALLNQEKVHLLASNNWHLLCIQVNLKKDDKTAYSMTYKETNAGLLGSLEAKGRLGGTWQRYSVNI
jgi:hypothetical protein